MFICGSGSFGHQDEDEIESYSSPCPTPKRSKRSTSFCKIMGKDNKNPFADRGLDKFYALLANLDDKKQKIYTRMGAEDILFVRFVYINDSNHVKPIVVKVKEKKQDKTNKDLIKKPIKHSTSNISRSEEGAREKTNITTVASQSTTSIPRVKLNKKPRKKRCLRCKDSFKLGNLKRHYFSFPIIVVVILLFLSIYGRSFAILCTSIGWYMAPTVVGGTSLSSANERKPKRKKEYARKRSEMKINMYCEGPSSPVNELTDIK